MMNDLNNEIKHIIEQNIPTGIKVYGWNEAVELKLIPETFKTSFVRVVTFDTSGCPCGGTHISSTSDMKELIVTKVQKKGKNVRVLYRIG
jgi:alanyl-tRNA synthetase